MDVVFIGEDFYDKSGSMMASTYKIENGELIRFCWADIEGALGKGQTVNIRPATDSEMLWAYKELDRTRQVVFGK